MGFSAVSLVQYIIMMVIVRGNIIPNSHVVIEGSSTIFLSHILQRKKRFGTVRDCSKDFFFLLKDSYWDKPGYSEK